MTILSSGKKRFGLKGLNRTKKLFVLGFVIASLFLNSLFADAHERDEHDEDIEYILFGDENYKLSHPTQKRIIKMLEDATYLCVDQFNGKGQDALDYLNAQNVPNIPASIEDFDFSSNYSHRSNTHRGWNAQYSETSHWEIRKSILLNTVEHVLFSENTPLSWFPWLSRIIYGKSYATQQEGFCILLYNIHILGDHMEASNYKDLAYIAPLTHLEDAENPGIIQDLINCSDMIFESQKDSYKYKEYRQELEILRDKSEILTDSVGGINTDEKFKEYHGYAENLRKILGEYLPDLLKKEDFFKKTFYN